MSFTTLDGKALFLHIPRTGGTWVSKLFVDLGIPIHQVKHPDYTVPQNHFLFPHFPPGILDRVSFIWCNVRHPIAYYESVWKWIAKVSEGMRRRWRWHPHMSATRLWCDDFNVWVGRMLKSEPLWYTRLIEQYVGPQGGEFVHWVCRTTTLREDMKDILKILRVDLTSSVLAAIDNSKKENVASAKISWDLCLKEEVLRTEHQVLDRFYGDRFLLKRVRRFCIPT